MGNGKFAQALGVMEIKVDGVYSELTPKMGDKRKLLKIVADSEKKGSVEMMDEMYKFIVDLFIRDHQEEPRNEIEMYVEKNLENLIQEILIAFKLTTRDKLEEKKRELEGKK